MENRNNEIGAVAGDELKKFKESQKTKMNFRTETPKDQVDKKRLDDSARDLHQCQKQEEGLRRRKSAARRTLNTLAASYRHDDEIFIRYLERDGVLLFRKKDGNGKPDSRPA